MALIKTKDISTDFDEINADSVNGVEITSTRIDVDVLRANTDTNIQVGNDLVPSQSAVNLGGTTKVWQNVYAANVSTTNTISANLFTGNTASFANRPTVAGQEVALLNDLGSNTIISLIDIINASNNSYQMNIGIEPDIRIVLLFDVSFITIQLININSSIAYNSIPVRMKFYNGSTGFAATLRTFGLTGGSSANISDVTNINYTTAWEYNIIIVRNGIISTYNIDISIVNTGNGGALKYECVLVSTIDASNTIN